MKIKLIILTIVVTAAGYNHLKRVETVRTEAERSGYVKGYKEALQVGACYGIQASAMEFGLPIQVECLQIPDELLPDSIKDQK